MTINTVFIHCSATQADWMAERHLSDKVAEIRRWHTAKGWRDIGYHWIIDRDGSVAPGRAETTQGAHVKGYNVGSIGICLLGGFGSNENDTFADHYTPKQDAALRHLLDDINHRYGPVAVRGHNEVAAKACPGFNVRRWLSHKPPRPKAASTTLQATAGGAVAVSGGVLSALGQLDPAAQVALVVAGVVALGAFAWIARERLRRWAKGDR